MSSCCGRSARTRRSASSWSGAARYGTDDIDSALDAVRGAGLRLIDERPRTGIRGSRVAFLHPKSTGGVLTELVEPLENH